MNTVGGDTEYADTHTHTDTHAERHTTPIIGHGPITVASYSVGIILPETLILHCITTT